MKSEDYLKGAFSALLRGDTAERDRLCDLGMVAIKAEDKAAAIRKVLSVDFYVTDAGVAVPTKRMAAAVL